MALLALVLQTFSPGRESYVILGSNLDVKSQQLFLTHYQPHLAIEQNTTTREVDTLMIDEAHRRGWKSSKGRKTLDPVPQ